MKKTLIAIVAGAAVLAPVTAMAVPEFQPRGRFHLDYGYNDEDVTDLSDGFLNRRARIGVSGKLDDDWGFQIEYDFAENDTAAKDVRLTRKLGDGTLKLGQFKVPFGLNELTSSNSITFLERSSPSNVTADSRRLGVGYDWYGDLVGVQAMAFGRAIGDDLGEGDMPIGAAVRAFFTPINQADMLLHLGAAVAYEDRRDAQVLRLRDRPESRASSETRLIDTGDINFVDTTLKAGAEVAFQAGPFSAEAEYFHFDIGRDQDDEPTFGGFHVQASYVLTGEKRGYRDGVFRGVSPRSSHGAWEVAARFSSVDLVDAGFEGGEQQNITVGLNYYATSNVRFMLNGIKVNVEDGVAGQDDEPTIIALRAQYSF